MNILQSIILGIVEGLTEFLPISSTFHLIFTAKILNLASSDFTKLFEVVIQSGAIFALVFIYAKTLLSDKKMFLNVVSSFIPTALIGFAFHKIIKDVFFESTWLMLAVFIVMGLIFLFLEKYVFKSELRLSKNCDDLSLKEAIIIGFAQALSIIPGVSRAGSVIVAMMLLGYKRAEAAKYTFLLSLPTIFAASALDLYQGRSLLLSMDSGWLLLGIGFFVALFTAYLVVKWLLQYLSSHTLELFGWYRLVIAALLIFFRV